MSGQRKSPCGLPGPDTGKKSVQAHSRSSFREIKWRDVCSICGHSGRCKREIEHGDDLVLCFRVSDDSVSGYRRIKTKGECSTYVREGSEADRSCRHGPRPVRRQSKASRAQPIPVSGFPQEENEKRESELEALASRQSDAIDGSRIVDLSEQLGVAADSLRAIGIGFDGVNVVFPERDATGRVVGICSRHADGSKWVGTGQSRGLCIPANLAELPDPVLIVEGASDVAACLSMGLAAVGRPSAKVGAAMLAELLRGRAVLVVGENDKKDDGAWPGRDGATHVATALAKAWASPVLWSLPPDGLKDLREALRRAESTDAKAFGIELLAQLNARAVQIDPSSLPVSTQGRNGKTTIEIRLTPVAELLSEPVEPTPCLVDGLLPWGGLSIMAGKPKAGKSTLARGIALSVARGDPVLGRKSVQGPVIYLALEDKRSEVAEHFRAMGAINDTLLIHTGPAPRPVGDAIEQLSAQAVSCGAVLIVIDTMLRFVPVRDVADYAEMTWALDPLLTLSRDASCHVMLVYHATKKDRPGLDGILGSVAISGTCDTGLIVKRRGDGVRSLFAQQRYGDDFPETVLMLDPKSRIVTCGEPLAQTERRDVRARIIDVLQSGEATESEIREQVGGNTGETGTVLRGLHKDGVVDRSGGGTKKSPYHYRLNEG